MRETGLHSGLSPLSSLDIYTFTEIINLYRFQLTWSFLSSYSKRSPVRRRSLKERENRILKKAEAVLQTLPAHHRGCFTEFVSKDPPHHTPQYFSPALFSTHAHN